MSNTPKAKIYTKKGDAGMTSLVDCSCVEKFHPRVEAYGCIDELNSYLGLVGSLMDSQNIQNFKNVRAQIELIQNELFIIGSLVACDDPAFIKKLPSLNESSIERIESQIDELSLELSELKNFILPGGSLLASHLHVARTLCRRAERRNSEIMMKQDNYQNGLKYLNRLSDYLFTLARWVNSQSGFSDIIWKK